MSNNGICSKSDFVNSLCNYGYLEDSKLALQQMSDCPIVIVQAVGIIISIAGFNASGVAITKFASAAQRSTIDTCRTLLIWVMALILGQEHLCGWLSLGQVGGFAMLIIGTLIYNEIVVVPCDLLSYNTKQAIASRNVGMLDGSEYETKKDMTYMATSPARYDTNRNTRNIEARMSKASASKRQDLLSKHNRRDSEGDMYINEISEQSNSQHKSNRVK